MPCASILCLAEFCSRYVLEFYLHTPLLMLQNKALGIILGQPVKLIHVACVYV